VAGGDLATQKPHPKNLLECLNHFKCSSDLAILIGDSTVDQKMAHSCGVPFAFFRPGYDDGVDTMQVSLILDAHIDLLSLNGLRAQT